MRHLLDFGYPKSTADELLDAAAHWDALADQEAHGIAIGVVDWLAGGHRVRTYRATANTMLAQASALVMEG